MNNLTFRWDYVIGICVGVGSALIGGWDLTLKVLLVLMGADIVTGIIKAFYNSNYNSKAFRKGLVTKAGFFIVIILAYQLDVIINNGEPMVRNVATMFYIAVEGTSIIENLGQMGIPLPKIIKEKLSALNGQVAEDKDKIIKKELTEVIDKVTDHEENAKG